MPLTPLFLLGGQFYFPRPVSTFQHSAEQQTLIIKPQMNGAVTAILAVLFWQRDEGGKRTGALHSLRSES